VLSVGVVASFLCSVEALSISVKVNNKSQIKISDVITMTLFLWENILISVQCIKNTAVVYMGLSRDQENLSHLSEVFRNTI